LDLGGKLIQQNTASQLYRLWYNGETLGSDFELSELRKRLNL
jgi:hypothetical protein